MWPSEKLQACKSPNSLSWQSVVHFPSCENTEPRKNNLSGSKCDIPLSERYRIERFCIFFSSGERLPVCYGSSHSVHGEEFPRQVSEFRALSTGEAVTSSAVAEELLPAEVK